MKHVRNKIKSFLIRPLFEKLGIAKYSKPALNELDKKLEKYLSFNEGVFLEVGANDGYKQSNTYYFERMKNWKGILIEPIPELFESCKKLRKKSQVFNYICSKPDDSGKNKTIEFADLMSQVEGSLGSEQQEKEHIRKGIKIQKIGESYEVNIDCKTLSEIIDGSKFSNFDLMSIDVEGYELEVLKGLDLERHAPEYLLVEIWSHNKKEVLHYLDNYFKIVEYLTERDILFKKYE